LLQAAPPDAAPGAEAADSATEMAWAGSATHGAQVQSYPTAHGAKPAREQAVPAATALILKVPGAQTMVSYVCVLVMQVPLTIQPSSSCMERSALYGTGMMKDATWAADSQAT